MPRPTVSTPIPTLVLTVNATCRWYENHAARLTPVMVPGDDPAPAGRQVASELQTLDEEFLLEQRQSVEATRKRLELIEGTRTLINAVEAAARRAFAAPGVTRSFNDVKRDFRDVAPSHIRTVSSAQKAIKTARVGLRTHGVILDAQLPRTERLLAELQQMSAALADVDDHETAEAQETRQVQHRRDLVRDAALDFLEQAQLAAQELAVTDPEPLADLETLFGEYEPTTRRGARSNSSEPTPSADDTPLGLDATHLAPASTPEPEAR